MRFSWPLMAIGLLLQASFSRAVEPAVQASTEATTKIVGLYIHQHWAYNHPYSARTWTVDDYRGYATGLKALGYNTLLIWPVEETMPLPLTPSDEANLAKIAKVIDMLHDELHMRVYITISPNVCADDKEASKSTWDKRRFFYCDTRVDPRDPKAVADLMRHRDASLRPLAKADGFTIIDSDPGGYAGSTNADFVRLIAEYRKLFDSFRPGIELVYWMHAGWEAYSRLYETGKFAFGTPEEFVETVGLVKKLNPEPWGLANGLDHAEKVGEASRVISFNYGAIEGEPTYPYTNFGDSTAYAAGHRIGPRGVVGNAQTHCLQLPNTFAFGRGAKGEPVTRKDYVQFANDLIPGCGELIVFSWEALQTTDTAKIVRARADLEKLDSTALRGGPLNGLLFNDPSRFVKDLKLQLAVHSALVRLVAAHDGRQALKAPLLSFTAASDAWQAQHGYENEWNWPELKKVLRSLHSKELDEALDIPETDAYLGREDKGKTPYERIARKYRETETMTPRLLQAMKRAAEKL